MRQFVAAALVTAIMAAGPAWAGDREDLIALGDRWNDAYVARDPAALAPLLAEDFLLIDGHGAVQDKATLLKGVADKRAQFDPIRNEDVVVRVYGDVAVVTGKFNLSLRFDGQPFAYVFRYTDVWRREGTSWVAISAQTTAVTQ